MRQSLNGRDRSDRKPGHLLSGGIEYATADKVSVKAEYNYVNCADWDETSLPSFLEKSDLMNHIAKAGVNRRFDGSIGRDIPRGPANYPTSDVPKEAL